MPSGIRFGIAEKNSDRSQGGRGGAVGWISWGLSMLRRSMGWTRYASQNSIFWTNLMRSVSAQNMKSTVKKSKNFQLAMTMSNFASPYFEHFPAGKAIPTDYEKLRTFR